MTQSKEMLEIMTLNIEGKDEKGRKLEKRGLR